MQVFLLHLLFVSVLVQNLIVEVVYLLGLGLDIVLDLVPRHAVCCPHCKGVCYQPVVHDPLSNRHKLISSVRTDLQPNRMD